MLLHGLYLKVDIGAKIARNVHKHGGSYHPGLPYTQKTHLRTHLNQNMALFYPSSEGF